MLFREGLYQQLLVMPESRLRPGLNTSPAEVSTPSHRKHSACVSEQLVEFLGRKSALGLSVV